MAGKVNVGIIGCGNIFPAYIDGCRKFGILDVVGCADLDVERARARAKEFKLSFGGSVAELLARQDIQIIVNITIPAAHAEVSLAALNAGKHVHSEKPLAVTRADGQRILTAAKERGLRVGCAPDTFLGGGLQTCRKLIDDGAIGQPVAGVAFFASHGPEAWHPNPGFLFAVGGGPLFDMGPYYLTALINFLGPIKRVTSSARITFPERICGHEAIKGKRIKVEAPTHVAGILDFANGAVVSMITSFDVWAANLPRIEIYGSEGSLSVPDPNTFGGDVKLRRSKDKDWVECRHTHDIKVGRGIGVADLAYGITGGRPHRVSGELAYHVLDAMHALAEASDAGRHIELASTCVRPAALPVGLAKGTLDA